MITNPSVQATTRQPMTQVEMVARAIARAREEHVYIRATARPGVYSTVSKSDPAQHYTLVAMDGVLGCSCKGFEYRKCCKHSEALKRRLARESRTPKAPANPAPATPALSGPAIVKSGACVCDLYDVARPCDRCGR